MPEYAIWEAMLQRCRNKKCKVYANYGGRGINVCEQWWKFENFYADMGPRPSAKHSIERNDNDGPYDPGNCTWATRDKQNRNNRHNRWHTMDGKTMVIADWADQHGMKRNTLSQRLSRGMDIREALFASVARGAVLKERNARLRGD